MIDRLLWGSCGSIFSFLCHGWQTFSGVRVAQSLCFLCHGWQTFSGVRVAQSLVFCVMVGRLLGVRVAQSLVFCVMVGRLLVGFVWLNLQFSVSWFVDFQWGSCGSIFSCLCHDWQTFSGVRVAQSLLFCVMVGRLLVGFVWLNLQFSVSRLATFSGVRVAQSLVVCVMVGRLLVGFVWLNLQFSVSWFIDFQWGSCGSIFSCLCHDWQTFSGVRMAQSLLICVMVGRLLVGFAWLNLQFSVSWLVDFQWGSCGSIFSFLCQGWRLLMGFVWLNLQFSISWLVDFQWGSCGSIFSFLRHGWHTFSGVHVSQSLVFCVMVERFLVGFVWLKLQFSVSWQVDFYWGSCGPIFMFSASWLADFQWGS